MQKDEQMTLMKFPWHERCNLLAITQMSVPRVLLYSHSVLNNGLQILCISIDRPSISMRTITGRKLHRHKEECQSVDTNSWVEGRNSISIILILFPLEINHKCSFCPVIEEKLIPLNTHSCKVPLPQILKLLKIYYRT